MRRTTIVTLSALIVVSLMASTAFAGNVHFSGSVNFNLGSLIASGTLAGLGDTDVTVILDAAGIPLVSCANNGGNQAPGQNPPKVTAEGSQFLAHNTYTKNGTSSFNVETQAPQTTLTAVELGCPNNNWAATIVFVYWTNATITVVSSSTGAVLLTQNFVCTTTDTSVSCTPSP